jgi:hypothetical protein
VITLNKTDDVLADVYRVEMNLSCTSFLHGACFSMRMILMIIIAIAIMMQETETSGEPDAIAIAAFVAKCNTNAARSMGISASMLEAYILDIGVLSKTTTPAPEILATGNNKVIQLLVCIVVI